MSPILLSIHVNKAQTTLQVNGSMQAYPVQSNTQPEN